VIVSQGRETVHVPITAILSTDPSMISQTGKMSLLVLFNDGIVLLLIDSSSNGVAATDTLAAIMSEMGVIDAIIKRYRAK